MKNILLGLLIFSGVAGAGAGIKYIEAPNKTVVEEAYFDAGLQMIVIKVRAEVLWFTVREVYGLRIKDSKTIDVDWKRIVGEVPEVVHLKVVP